MNNNWDFDQARQMGQLWLEMFSRLGSTMTSATPGEAPPEAARHIRSAIFNAMAEQMEQFMRSETFLAGMKQGLDNTIKIQKQYQAAMTQMRHSTEGVASQDITAVMTLLREVESRLLDRLEDLDQRLDRLEAGKHARGNGRAHAEKTQPAESGPAEGGA